MKKFLVLACGVASFSTWAASPATPSAPLSAPIQQVGEKSQPATNVNTEDFKGKVDPEDQDFGALTGLAIVDGTAGFALIGTIARRIIPKGFVPDIADSVSLEADFGPIFGLGQTTLYYDAHLRWDFFKDPAWTFYALGGVGGTYENYSPSRNEIFPRFGVGAFWKFFENFAIRAEVSHELVVLGAAFPF